MMNFLRLMLLAIVARGCASVGSSAGYAMTGEGWGAALFGIVGACLGGAAVGGMTWLIKEITGMNSTPPSHSPDNDQGKL